MRKSILSIAFIALISFTSCKEENEQKPMDETAEEINMVSGNFKTDSLAVVKWTGKKLTGSHFGTIALQEGNFIVTDGKLTGGDFVLDMNSIVVADLEGDGKADLEGHLKGLGDKTSEDHFFNTAKFPYGSFKITSVTEENGKAKITGDLTLKGITNPIEFPAMVTTTENELTFKSDVFKIDRTKWGVNYGSKSVFENIGDKVIYDDIELELTLVAKK